MEGELWRNRVVRIAILGRVLSFVHPAWGGVAVLSVQQ